MVGKKGASAFVASNAPVTAIQPAASSTKNTPAINSAPRERPKPKSSHHSPSMRNPNPDERGRRSKKRPASHTLKSAATNEATPTDARKTGEAARASIAPSPRLTPPKKANTPDT